MPFGDLTWPFLIHEGSIGDQKQNQRLQTNVSMGVALGKLMGLLCMDSRMLTDGILDPRILPPTNVNTILRNLISTFSTV